MGTQLANKLMDLMRSKDIAINRFLELANIPNRNLYNWINGESVPNEQQQIRLKVAIKLLGEY